LPSGVHMSIEIHPEVSRFTLPAGLAGVLRPELPVVAAQISAAIEATDAGFDTQPLRMGVGEALRQFVDEIELQRRERPRRLFFNFGRTEMRAGRPLAGLLEAYRLGGRLAWRRFAAAGRAADVPPETLHLLAEAVFGWIAELSDQSAAGYDSERSAAASAAQLRRERVVRLLVGEPAVDGAVVEAAAGQAPWPLPASLAACAVADEGGRLLAALPSGVIAAPRGELLCVCVPDPGARARELARLLEDRGLTGVLGPAGPWRRCAVSWRRAVAAHTLVQRGVIARPAALIHADDHPELLLLAADPELAADLAARRLAPLAGLTPAQRARFTATLGAWLAHRGALAPMAAELGVHPQTVRYRVARLRDLFGAALEDPQGRLQLELALRARAVAG
jgi:hypothetical protein